MKELLFKINDNDIMLSRLKKITVFKICVLVFFKKMKYLQIKKNILLGKYTFMTFKRLLNPFKIYFLHFVLLI